MKIPHSEERILLSAQKLFRNMKKGKNFFLSSKIFFLCPKKFFPSSYREIPSRKIIIPFLPSDNIFDPHSRGSIPILEKRQWGI